MLTLNEIVAQLTGIADAHGQIAAYGVGDLGEWNPTERNYPLLWIHYVGAETSDGVLDMTFRVGCFDRVLAGEEGEDVSGHEQEVLSDTQLILLDVLAYFAQGQHSGYYSARTSNLTPATETMDDRLAGHFIDLTISQDWDFSKCQIPASFGSPSPDVDGLTLYDFCDTSVQGRLTAGQITCLQAAFCGEATVNVNSDLFDTVAAGGTLNVPVQYENGTPVGTITGGVVEIPDPVVCASVSVGVTDTTPDVGQLVTITATPSNFTPTTYVFLLPQGGDEYVHVSQAGNTYDWYVSAEGSWDVCVLATDGTDYVYGTVQGTSNATLFGGLDTTPHYAFSVTECLSAEAAQATKFITIRRSSDNATADFNWGEFIGGDAETWVGANDGFITWLFDQTGNGRPYSTNSSGVQPKIIDNGSLVDDGSGNVMLECAAGQGLYTFTDGTQGQLGSGANTGLTGSSGALFTVSVSTDNQYTFHGEQGIENGSAKVIQGSVAFPTQFLGTPTYKVDGVAVSPATSGQLYTDLIGGVKLLSLTTLNWSANWVWNNWNRPHMGVNYGGGFAGKTGCQIVFNDTPTANDISEIETHLMNTY